MRKKSWLIGATVLATVAVFGAFGIHSVKATETESKSAKEQIIFENVGDRTYTSYSDRGVGVALATEDGKYYAMIDEDGTTTEIDNSSGKYESIVLSSSTYFDNCMYALDKDGNGAILNYNGSFAYGTDKYYSHLTKCNVNKETMCAYIDNGKAIIRKKDGTIFFEAAISIKKDDVVRFAYSTNRFVVIYTSDATYYYDMNSNGKDVTDIVSYNGKTPSMISVNTNGDMKLGYYISGKGYTYVYLDKDLNPVSPSDSNMYNSIGFDSVKYNNSYGGLNGIFNKYISFNDRIQFEDGYKSYFSGVLKGFKVYLGEKFTTIKNPDKPNSYIGVYKYAIYDEDCNLILDNVASLEGCLADKIVTKIFNDNSKAEYHIVKAVLVSETGTADIKKDSNNNSVADVTAKEVDMIDVKDASGKTLTYDELDKDAKDVYNQKFNFNIKASNGVIADGAAISVDKVLAGANYEAAKKVTKDAASHIAVFNIDLLKDGAKIQPNGNIEFTVDVPNNFNKDLIAVYRLSSDGTSYVKLTSSVKDGKVTFVTDHFSTYIIAEEKTVINTGDNNNNSGNNNDNTGNKDNNNASNNENSNIGNGNGANNNEQASGAEASNVEASNAEASNTSTATGDTTNYIIYIAVLLCAAAVGVVAMTSKKRAK